MVNWKVALVVVIIAALVVTIGVWFGYRYVSEQDDLSPEGRREPPKTVDSRLDESFVAASARVVVCTDNIVFYKYYSSLCLFEKGESKL